MSRKAWTTRHLNTLERKLMKTLSACNKSHPDIKLIEKQYAKCLDLQSQLEERGVSKEDYAKELERIKHHAVNIKNRIDKLNSDEVNGLIEKLFTVCDHILNICGIPPFLSALLDLVRSGKRAIGWTTQEKLEWDDDEFTTS